MKWLYWLAAGALAIPCLAWAASLTVPLTITVNGSGVLLPPPAARTAGFTTSAFNADFSLPKYANALNNSWLCNRASDDGTHVCEWYDGIWYNLNWPLDGVGANTIGQVFDSTINQNVLEMSWDPSYCPAYFFTPRFCTAPYNVIELVSYKDQGEALTPQLAIAFPANNIYMEKTMRDNEFLITSGDTTSAMVWWPRCGFNANNCSGAGALGQGVTEIDNVENWANGCRVPDPAGTTSICNGALQACHVWSAGDCNGSPRGGGGDSAAWTWIYPGIGDPEFNVYHRYGVLITSTGIADGTGNVPFEECSFTDDVLKGCIPGHTGSALNRNTIEYAGGLATGGQLAAGCGTFVNGVCSGGTRQHIWTSSIRVWACAAWNATEPSRQCNRTGICDNTGPGGSLVCH